MVGPVTFKIIVISPFILFTSFLLGVSSVVAESSSSSTSKNYLHQNARVEYYEQKVDHFSYTSNETFNQRVIIYDGEWKNDGDPIFMYTGNEDDIFMFANYTGFVWEIANEFSALVVFAEHRYYGKSLPFGNKSFSSPQKYGYLSISQAMGDFAEDIRRIKSSYNASNSPVIVFGGSYGGMLAVYMRQKYPYLVEGALASSAPILIFPSLYNCSSFNYIVSNDFAEYNESCVQAVKQSWPAFRRIASTKKGINWIKSTFQLCPDDPEKQFDIDYFFSWIGVIYSVLAMTDYPMESGFLKEKPAFPIREFCREMPSSKVEDKKLIQAIYNGLSISYLNYTGSTKCNSLSEDDGTAAWTIQSCTEIVTPICTSDLDMFEPTANQGEFNLAEFSDSCKYYYGLEPNLQYVETELVGQDLSSLSNVIFSNGLRDPWSSGGVLKSDNPNIDILILPQSCHHEDLRGSEPSDSPQLVKVRNKEKEIIRRWIKQHQQRKENQLHGDLTTTTTTTTTTSTTSTTTQNSCITSETSKLTSSTTSSTTTMSSSEETQSEEFDQEQIKQTDY